MMTERVENEASAPQVTMLSKTKVPQSLIDRFPSPDLVAKAGTNWAYGGDCKRRIIRNNSKA